MKNIYYNNQWKTESPNENDLTFDGYKLLMNQAFEPNDVNWKSFYYTGKKRL